jgi:hypothetical protein
LLASWARLLEALGTAMERIYLSITVAGTYTLVAMGIIIVFMR